MHGRELHRTKTCNLQTQHGGIRTWQRYGHARRQTPEQIGDNVDALLRIVRELSCAVRRGKQASIESEHVRSTGADSAPYYHLQKQRDVAGRGAPASIGPTREHRCGADDGPRYDVQKQLQRVVGVTPSAIRATPLQVHDS